MMQHALKKEAFVIISLSVKSVESGENAIGDCASCIDSSKPTEDCVLIRYYNRSKEELFKNYGLLLCIEHKQEPVK